MQLQSAITALWTLGAIFEADEQIEIQHLQNPADSLYILSYVSSADVPRWAIELPSFGNTSAPIFRFSSTICSARQYLPAGSLLGIVNLAV